MQRFHVDGWRGRVRSRLRPEHPGRPVQELSLPGRDLVGMNVKLLRQFGQRLLAPHGGQGHLRLEIRRVVPARSSAHRLSCSAAILAAVRQKLHLSNLFKNPEPALNALHIGHSTGGGEVARYVARFGQPQGRVAKAVLVSAVPPLMVKTESNPDGTPIEAFDEIRAGVLADRSQFWKDLTIPFYGANRPGASVSQGVRDAFWLQGMQGGLKNEYECIEAFSETDLTEDLKKFDVPTLIIHGDDDQIVPIVASALASSKLVKN